ncbi:hypothetical protein C8R45DRAFT_1097658 [Mycena sanguinolenta]|nr:hypothetical protein C8R45DRAFT_1097658 [Mycena sanguinolenta]
MKIDFLAGLLSLVAFGIAVPRALGAPTDGIDLHAAYKRAPELLSGTGEPFSRRETDSNDVDDLSAQRGTPDFNDVDMLSSQRGSQNTTTASTS